MSITVLRIGLWMLILSLVLFVIDTSYDGTPIAELITADLLQKIFLLSGVLVIAGIILRIFDKTAGKVLQKTNHCRVCNAVIPAGQIFCRVHLRGMLEREDRKTHSTRIR